jgi:hypothetical protein
MKKWIDIPQIPLMEQTPREKALLDVIDRQQGMIDDLVRDLEILKDEIKRLKGHKSKPRIKPSKMDKPGNNKDKSSGEKRAGSEKRNKNTNLTIHEEKTISANSIPEGSRFKGYQYYVVQDLVIQARNTRYRLERWQLPNGEYCVVSLPADIAGCHFGSTLRSFIDYQYHHQHVTQPLLFEQLRDYGIDISAGELNRLITENKEDFHKEKTEILPAGIASSAYIHVDDTGARHQGKNGYCTHIGNELFAWFESTGSKSRINFLELLQMGRKEYAINTDALDYMKRHKLPSHPLHLLQSNPVNLMTLDDWKNHLDVLGINNPRHRQIATEGALVGSILLHGFYINLKIMSDDAGQFNVFQHILCWIHAERKINELVPLHDGHAKDIQSIRSLFWEIYALLKDYKQKPNEAIKIEIEKKFDSMCSTQTSYQLLNNVLKRLMKNKEELLLVLKHPELPLHNNLSERDIREYVKKRKISGGTRSNEGRRCRDTFASLKKTCRKLKVNFWNYLLDRHSKKSSIPWLPTLIGQIAATS